MDEFFIVLCNSASLRWKLMLQTELNQYIVIQYMLTAVA